MKTKQIFLFLLITILSLPAESNQIVEFKLENGMTIILDKDSEVKSAVGLLAVKAGSKHDPDMHTGVAHYFEHMLFKGSDKIGAIDWVKEQELLNKIADLYDQLYKSKSEQQSKKINKEINELSIQASQISKDSEFTKLSTEIGGKLMNAGTSWDFTIFYSSFDPSQLSKWLKLYSTVFRTPSFRNFQAELEVVYEEQNLYSDNIMVSAGQQLLKKAFKNHPYGTKPILGTVEHLKKPSLSAAKNFFQTYYVPNNMALIISGNFDESMLKKEIENSFGTWLYKDLKPFPEYPEQDFQGREYEELDLGYVNFLEAGILAFRTTPSNHKDNVKLDVIESLLSNSAKTGFIDQLTLDDQVYASGFQNLQLNDHGMAVAFFLSKFTFFFSNFEEDEKSILAQFNKLKKGDFSDEQLEFVKLNIKKKLELENENRVARLRKIATQFTQGKSVKNQSSYIQELEKISKKDITETAKKYFGENYQITEVGIGVPFKLDNQRVEKPDVKPIKFVSDSIESSFAKNFKSIENFSGVMPYREQNKVKKTELTKAVNLYQVTNSKNTMFQLTIEIEADINDTRKLPLLAYMMDYAHTAEKNLNEIKSYLYQRAADFTSSYDKGVYTIEISAFEKDFADLINLVAEIYNKPLFDNKKLESYEDLITARNFVESSDAGNQISALAEYIKYGDKSKYLNRLSEDAIEEFRISTLSSIINNNLKISPVNIFYSGSKSTEELKTTLSKFNFNPIITERPDRFRIAKSYSKPTLFLLENDDLTQSKIYFYFKGEKFSHDLEISSQIFNPYFGKGFNSILFEQIRKKRSFVYNVSAEYTSPEYKERNFLFQGNLFTQTDKTIDAINSLTGLLDTMPELEYRVPYLRSFLTNSLGVEEPEFRDKAKKFYQNELLGLDDGFKQKKIDKFANLDLETLVSFYEQAIKGKHLVIGIVGDIDEIQLEKLNKKFEIVELENDMIFSE